MGHKVRELCVRKISDQVLKKMLNNGEEQSKCFLTISYLVRCNAFLMNFNFLLINHYT